MLTSATLPLRKYGGRDLWQQPTTAPQHQRAAAVDAKGEGGMEIEKEDEGRKQRGAKVWGRVHFYERAPL